VQRIDPLRDPRWAELVQHHPAASAYHSTAWLRALRDAYGYEPVTFATCETTGRLTSAIVLCGIRSWLTGKRLVSLPFSDHCDPLVADTRELEWLIGHVKSLIGAPWDSVEIRPRSIEPSGRLGFRKNAIYYCHELSLEKTKERLFGDFHKDSVQRKVRRAERENLSYDEGNSEPFLRNFYRLLMMTRRKLNLPPQPPHWFRSLMAAFGKDLKIRVASKDGVPVASILTLSFRNTMTYKYGCSDPKRNNLGGMPFLLWRAIEDAKANGCLNFDMGRSDIGASGLIRFKEHFGAARSVINYWVYPSPARFSGLWKNAVAQRACALAPNAVSMAIGNFLYPHIG
jgi:hypothetical protein